MIRAAIAGSDKAIEELCHKKYFEFPNFSDSQLTTIIKDLNANPAAKVILDREKSVFLTQLSLFSNFTEEKILEIEARALETKTTREIPVIIDDHFKHSPHSSAAAGFSSSPSESVPDYSPPSPTPQPRKEKGIELAPLAFKAPRITLSID